MKEKKTTTRRYEFRILYQRDSDIIPYYHYYMCESAKQALQCQLDMIQQRNWNIKLLSIERLCPWTSKWCDESGVLTSNTTVE